MEGHNINKTVYITTIFYKYGTQKHMGIKRRILITENKHFRNDGFGVFRAVTMKGRVFWVSRHPPLF
jgi:hypothetical protein